ncbi:hypothetical protein COCNU_09G005240 [Cocos nucifera]|uniref:Uncharacterized protein n=1 Tax=Cocos nucifera TaxID=13894 RepID=A0A8K0IKG9_COCNU|nr:hypothetical protein COCNU_09G005240 [Cocos nucifera]
MNSLTATRSMLVALVGMTRAIDAARNKISTSSSSSSTTTLSAVDELMDVLIRCRRDIEDAAVSLEAAAEAASGGRDATASRRLRLRLRCLKLMAKSWRGRLEEQRWRRCVARCYLRSTEKRVLSLKRIAAMACHVAEKRVVRLREPRVAALEAAEVLALEAAVDDAEGTALADFRAMADALVAIRSGRDAMEDSEEYQGILRGMERLFSSP